MRTALFLILSAWAAAGAAQTMYKCFDNQRRVTYSNVSCEKQGLKEGGVVEADRVTTMPSTQPGLPKPPPQGDPAKPPQGAKLPPPEQPKK